VKIVSRNQQRRRRAAGKPSTNLVLKAGFGSGCLSEPGGLSSDRRDGTANPLAALIYKIARGIGYSAGVPLQAAARLLARHGSEDQTDSNANAQPCQERFHTEHLVNFIISEQMRAQSEGWPHNGWERKSTLAPTRGDAFPTIGPLILLSTYLMVAKRPEAICAASPLGSSFNICW